MTNGASEQKDRGLSGNQDEVRVLGTHEEIKTQTGGIWGQSGYKEYSMKSYSVERRKEGRETGTKEKGME